MKKASDEMAKTIGAGGQSIPAMPSPYILSPGSWMCGKMDEKVILAAMGAALNSVGPDHIKWVYSPAHACFTCCSVVPGDQVLEFSFGVFPWRDGYVFELSRISCASLSWLTLYNRIRSAMPEGLQDNAARNCGFLSDSDDESEPLGSNLSEDWTGYPSFLPPPEAIELTCAEDVRPLVRMIPANPSEAIAALTHLVTRENGRHLVAAGVPAALSDVAADAGSRWSDVVLAVLALGCMAELAILEERDEKTGRPVAQLVFDKICDRLRAHMLDPTNLVIGSTPNLAAKQVLVDTCRTTWKALHAGSPN